MKFKSDIEVQAGLRDSSGSLGASGQILSSTSGNVSWVTPTVNTVASDVQNQVKAGVAINKGQAVYVTGADGTNIIVGLASNTSEATSSKTLGLLNATVATNGFADVVQIGRLAGLNTLGANAGDPVWLGTSGNLIYGLANKPYAPAHLVFLGIVTRVNSSNGEIFVNVQNGFELKEIHDVDIITNVPINGDVLGYDGTLWVNKTIAEWLGYTPANASGTTNYLSKFTGTTSLGNSQIFDNGTNVGIGTSSPSEKLEVQNGTSGAKIKVSNTGGGYASLECSSNATSVAQLSFTNQLSLIGGNVGIGTSSPSNYIGYTTLSINNTSSGGLIDLQNNGTSALRISADSTTQVSIYGATAVPMIFSTNSSERMRITSGGNVGIGTSSPSNAKFVVSGSSASGSIMSVDTSSTTSFIRLLGDIASQNLFNWQNGTDLRFATSNQDYSSFAERMRIDSSGNILVGQTSPIYSATNRANLTIGKSAGSILVLGTSTAANGYLFYNNTDLELANSTSSGSVFFRTSGTERMRITSSGAVGIGTTSPSGLLHLQGNTTNPVAQVIDNLNAGTSAGTRISFRYQGTETGYIYNRFNGGDFNTDIGSSDYMRFLTSGSERMRITWGGNVGIGTSSPGGRLQVASATAGDDQIWLQSTTYTGGYSTLGYNANTGEFRIKQNDGGSAGITFYTGASASEKMRITPSGNVCIGTTSALHTLSVAGTIGGNTYGDSFVEFAGSGNTLVKANDNVILGYSQSTAIKQNGSVGIGTTTPDASAILQLDSTTQGFLLPRMGNTDMVNISSPAQGLMVFNTDNNVVCVYDGSTWQRLAYI